MGWKQRDPVSQLTSFTLSTEKMEKMNKEEYVVKCCILILDSQKVVKINPESEIKNSQDIEGMY